MLYCPRCGGEYEEHLAALSRTDNITSICPECGLAEALLQHMGEDISVASGTVRWALPPMGGK